MTGASTTFVPANYFGNEGADEKKWNDLIQRLQCSGQELQSVLDVGCGRGAFLRFLRAQYPGILLTGIELDPERADQARCAVPDARIYTGDAQNVLNAIDQTFDLITLWDVFEHVPQPLAILKALEGKLSKTGCIFIQTINESSFVPLVGRLSYRLTFGLLRTIARRTHEAHHLVFFTNRGLRILANEANLKITDLWFDRLMFSRMDGNRLIAWPTAMVLALENFLGNGLFIDVILRSTVRPTVAENVSPKLGSE
jgi:2-polyprenyl-3-methyl-5-hydroxy-6-metoxy-1,4-benzoquinol methylase